MQTNGHTALSVMRLDAGSETFVLQPFGGAATIRVADYAAELQQIAESGVVRIVDMTAQIDDGNFNQNTCIAVADQATVQRNFGNTFVWPTGGSTFGAVVSPAETVDRLSDFQYFVRLAGDMSENTQVCVRAQRADNEGTMTIGLQLVTVTPLQTTITSTSMAATSTMVTSTR